MLTIPLGLGFIACEKSSDELYDEQNLEVNHNLSENVIQSDKVNLPSKKVVRI